MTQAWAAERAPTEVVTAARVAAARVAKALQGSRDSISTAESLTAGLVASTLGEVPGISEWFVGGVVAYSYQLKVDLLGLDPQLLESEGAVTEQVAVAMAQGVAQLAGARWAVATTGVAGPGPAEGKPEGTVWLAAVDSVAGTVASRKIDAAGGRDEVRWRACAAGLELLAESVEQNRHGGR